MLVDLYRVASIADVTVRLERAYARHLKGAVRARVDQFLQRTGIGLSLGVHGISARIQLDPKADPLPALHALLDLPLRLEQSGGYRALIAFDEFQDVDKVPDLDGLIRSHIQYHGDVASYVFAGSEPGLMKQLFEDRDRPLYGSAVPMRLGRLAARGCRRVRRRPLRGDRPRASARRSGRCCAAADGHPQRAMLLAHRLWAQVERGASATLEDWQRGSRGGARRARGRVRRRVARTSTRPSRRRCARCSKGDGSPYRRRRARAARADEGHGAEGAAAARRIGADRAERRPARDRRPAASRSGSGAAPTRPE